MSDCTVCAYRTKGPLQGLENAALQELEKSLRGREVEAGEVVFVQGEPVEEFFFLCGGSVKLVRESNEGKQSIVGIVGPCGWFGEFTFEDGAAYSVTAEVLAPARIKSIRRKDMAGLLRREPELLFEMVENLNEALRDARSRSADYAYLPVRRRTLRLLTKLFDRYGRPVNGHWELGVPLARAEIAEMLGTTPETAIRTLAQLQREGHVKLGRKRIAVGDPKALRALAERENFEEFN